nr:TetR/AcrR family transcriptional regulator [Serratia marcescens]
MTEKTIKRTEQVNQTMAMLTEALTKLMVKKPLDQITIAELTEEAGLARRTFYRHVKTIDD